MIPPPKAVHADSSRIISIYFDGQKKVITSDAPTVEAALLEAGVPAAATDLVEPKPATAISPGFFNINVYRSRPVQVVDGSRVVSVNTAFQSPVLISQAAGLTVYPEDVYDVSLINDIAGSGLVGQKVVIHRATPVFLVSDGVRSVIRTQQPTVGGVLDERDIALGPQDQVVPPRDTLVKADMVIQINRVKIVTQKVTEAIARDVRQVKDPNVDAGTTKVQEEGKDGSKESIYRIHYQNGVEKSRETLASTVITAPVTKVILIGTKINYSADPVQLGKQMSAARGWVDGQWDALYQLWDRESGWNPNSTNFWSGACGIPQAYPCSKIRDKSPAGQITWGLDYIAGKYGNPANAWAYWQKNHSY
ncbi:MAG TPA: G5 domain-containing protein [Candidatus Saccharimonadales bacterium]|nr:G5 domain-containing protein [Candidatus Saccharimonadales bacterium]